VVAIHGGGGVLAGRGGKSFGFGVGVVEVRLEAFEGGLEYGAFLPEFGEAACLALPPCSLPLRVGCRHSCWPALRYVTGVLG
jgi:hypothetical protein